MLVVAIVKGKNDVLVLQREQSMQRGGRTEGAKITRYQHRDPGNGPRSSLMSTNPRNARSTGNCMGYLSLESVLHEIRAARTYFIRGVRSFL